MKRWDSERFRELRKAHGETQEEFGRRLGVSRLTVVNYERGYPIPEVVCNLLDRIDEDLKAGQVRKLQPA